MACLLAPARPALAAVAVSPLLVGDKILVETCLPHLPGDAKVTVSWLGRPKAVFAARVGRGTIDISRYPPGEYALTIEAMDPQSPKRSLYYRAINVRKEDPEEFPSAARGVRLVVAADGAAWESADAPAVGALWDAQGTAEALLAGGVGSAKWGVGSEKGKAAGHAAHKTCTLQSEIRLVPRTDAESRGQPANARPGDKGLQAVLRLRNPGDAPVQVLAAGVRVWGGGGRPPPPPGD